MSHLHSIVGCMYAGKSTELIRQMTRAKIAGKNIKVFKPVIDDRYSTNEVVTHDGVVISTEVVASVADIPALVNDSVDVVGIDELQFFEEESWKTLVQVVSDGTSVVTAGLSNDFLGKPFESVARVSMLADDITRLSAVCLQCGSYDAMFNQMVDQSGLPITFGDRIQVGGSEKYEPRCRGCFVTNRRTVNV